MASTLPGNWVSAACHGGRYQTEVGSIIGGAILRVIAFFVVAGFVLVVLAAMA